MKQPGLLYLISLFTGLLAACDDPARPLPVASLEFRVAEPFVEVGDTLHLVAVLRDAAGNEVSGQPVAWSSDSDPIATVQDGVVTGKAPGRAMITASVGAVRDSVEVTVEQAIGSLRIEYPTTVLAVGGSVPARANLFAPSGRGIAGTPVRWSSSNPSVATVSDSGKVKGVAPGTAVITAKVGRKSAQATLEIVRPYTLTLLGALGGGEARPSRINELGQVVGTVHLADGRKEAFLWENGRMTSLGSGEAFDINDRGQVAGASGGAAVMWENGVKKLLYSKPGGNAQATAINRHGQVVGNWIGGTGCGPGGGCPGSVFLFRDGAATEIIPSATNPEANGINDDGWVVGATGRSSNYEHRPFLYRDGARTELAVPFNQFCRGPCGSATDVNNRGEIVGGGSYSPFLYWSSPQATAVTSPVAHSLAKGRINDRGEILYATELWRDGKRIPLAYLVAEPGWSMGGLDINHRGQIVGGGRNDVTGAMGALLLTPPQ